MNLSSPFVKRPIATVLLTAGIALAGIAGFFVLPVAPLPQVDYPAISVNASIPGASPDTMANSVATPLERRLGTISGVNEMTSTSGSGSTRISLQFDLNRDIDGAAREVQAAINASRADLPAALRSPIQPISKFESRLDTPILIIIALTSDTLHAFRRLYDAVFDIVLAQKLSQVERRRRSRASVADRCPPCGSSWQSEGALQIRHPGLEDVRAALGSATMLDAPKGRHGRRRGAALPALHVQRLRTHQGG